MPAHSRNQAEDSARPASIQRTGVPGWKAKCPRQQSYQAGGEEYLLGEGHLLKGVPRRLPQRRKEAPEARAAGTLSCDRFELPETQASAACQVTLGCRHFTYSQIWIHTRQPVRTTLLSIIEELIGKQCFS